MRRTLPQEAHHLPPVATAAACQICGAAERRLFIEYRGMTLYECVACGLVFLDPAPNAVDLSNMYDDTYAGATTSYFRKVGAKLARSRGRMRRLARYLPGGTPARRFLDIGCNGGFMVEAARELGFTALGVEPDGPAIAFARQTFPHNSFCHGLFETSDLGPEPFDAIYCSEVIEHAADANRFVARIANILKPGGVLYLTTPDIGHWRRPRDIRQWDAFTPPAHCLYFNPDNLTQLLAKHGLRVIRRRLAFKPGIKLFARKI